MKNSLRAYLYYSREIEVDDCYDLTRKIINGNGSKRDNKTVCAHAAIFSREIIELSQVDADFANISDSQKTPEYSTF